MISVEDGLSFWETRLKVTWKHIEGFMVTVEKLVSALLLTGTICFRHMQREINKLC